MVRLIGVGMRRTRMFVMTVLLTGIVSGVVSSAAARAEGCSVLTEQVRGEQAYAAGLPDCRAYEQVSVSKGGVDALGEVDVTQAAPLGTAVSFFSLAPFPGAVGAKHLAQSQFGLRSPSGDAYAWSTVGLFPPASAAGVESSHIAGLTEDLAKTILSTKEPVLADGAVPGPKIINAYVRDNATGDYQLLAPNIEHGLRFADAARHDTRILFESTDNLATTNVSPALGFTNLYVWDESKPVGERVSLAGVLPNGKAPVKGAVAGPGGPAIEPLFPGGSTSLFYTQGTSSESGAYVFFTDFETGFVYMRELEAERTVQISAGTEPAFWRAATPDGNFVFYTEGGELYRFNVNRFENSNEPEAVALAEAREPLTSGAKGVLGTLGTSNDGSYAYFVASSVLANNKREYDNTKNEPVIEEAELGKNNLYEWHQGSGTTFIAILQGGVDADERDWLGNFDSSDASGSSGGDRSSRVTPDGKEVLFSSVSPLTGHASVPECEIKAHPCYEFYLYDAESPVSPADLVCVSCNPTGATMTGNAFLSRASSTLPIGGGKGEHNAFVTHNLSDGGGRVFFETREALVFGDVNNQWDVYEWEREGNGSCSSSSSSFSHRSGGCIYLISTGQSTRESYFGDASADGSDVFFFTEQSLVSQDRDVNMDVYDARVNGGIAAQNPPPPLEPCADEDACRGVSGAPPVIGSLSSLALSGSGNLAALPVAGTVTKKRVVKCSRGKKLSHGKCVKTKAGGRKKPKGKKADNKRRGK